MKNNLYCRSEEDCRCWCLSGGSHDKDDRILKSMLGAPYFKRKLLSVLLERMNEYGASLGPRARVLEDYRGMTLRLYPDSLPQAFKLLAGTTMAASKVGKILNP